MLCVKKNKKMLITKKKKTAQRELRAYAFITVTSRNHALNNAVKSSKKHSAEFSSTNHVSLN